MKTKYLQAFAIPTSGMEPSIMSGDFVLADKTACRRRAPQIGDIIIFADPDKRSRRFIKRVEVLPGHSITLTYGTKQQVPHGSVYAVGQNRDKSIDSRQSAFLPLRTSSARPARSLLFNRGQRNPMEPDRDSPFLTGAGTESPDNAYATR